MGRWTTRSQGKTQVRYGEGVRSRQPAQPSAREAGACRAGRATVSLDPLLLSADEPTSPKKPKSIEEPEPGDGEGKASPPPPAEWTSVRISPGEDVVGQDVLAVCVLVTSDDSRYAQTAAGWGQSGLGRGGPHSEAGVLSADS